MNRAAGVVGSWYFSRESFRVMRHDDDTLGRMAVLAVEVMDVLAAHDLLFPQSVEASGWRLPLGGPVDDSVPGAGPAQSLPLSADRPVDAAMLTELLTGLARAESAFPDTLTFHGRGTIVHEGAEVDIPDPVVLKISAQFEVMANVTTDLTLWLPYTLEAEEQWDFSAANLPRLSNALRALAALPEITESHVDYTRYAEIYADGLRNHVDSVGKPVRVV